MLQLPYKLLILSGIWMPEDWTRRRQKIGWLIFSFMAIGLVFIQFSTLVIFLMMSKSLAQFFERVFLIPAGASSLQKIYVIVIHRKKLIDLSNMLLKDYCMPRNFEELSIQHRYEEFIRVITLVCFVLVNITVMNLLVSPLVTNGENRTLPMNVWLPYPVDSAASYWFSYTHQTLSTFLLGTGAVGSTLMINGFMCQVCCQFEILSYRFQRLPQAIKRLQFLNKPNCLIYAYEKKTMRQIVQHHLHIFKVADRFNDIFKSVIFQQFSKSSIVVSISIFQLSSKSGNKMEFIAIFCYLLCVLIEFLIYSWFGNEVMLESLNFQKSVYKIDWTALSTNSGKDLVFIMMRASRPVVIYCGHFIILSLESYLGILKVSYSVFNILRESSN